MQQETTQKYEVKVSHQIVYSHDSTLHLGQEKKKPFENNKQQTLISVNKNQVSKQNDKWHKLCFPQFVKRQLLRFFFIPLLIVLFLLTITLTFKQNNYQTNDYFYSKNIQINRKIRGVVPPLNETKSNIFGEYKIGLLQSFNVQDRRMLQNFRVQMWRNQSMKVAQIGKDDKCWSVYKLKFYSSTIFIEKKQSHLMNISTVKNNAIANENNTTKQIQNQIIKGQGIQNNNQSPGTQINSSIAINSQTPQTHSNTALSNTTTESKIQSASNSSQQQTHKVTQSSDSQQSICQLQKWSKLNQIFGNSHIWTFAEGNFYLMEFSQLQEDSNGVLIMKLTSQYPNVS